MTKNDMLNIMQDVAEENNRNFKNASFSIELTRKHKFKLTDCISIISIDNTTIFLNSENSP